jgi:hypothetical protein
MRMLLGFALSVLITQAACSGDDLTRETLIGATCTSAKECDVTGVCILGKDGLCSLKCDSPGQPQQCPLGAYCDERTVETSSETIQPMTLCFPACKANAECRTGFECKAVKNGSGKVCVPPENARDE